MSTADFLLELGCEEIPARMLEGASLDLAGRIANVLDHAGLGHGESRPLCTPRRLSVIVREVALRQSDRDEEVTGPPAKAAYGPDGKPTKAAAGFAQKMGVEPSALATISTPKGDYLGVRRHVAGRSASEILAEDLPRAITGMPFPKAMRWGDGSRRFVRPVHWIVALLGTSVVPVELFGLRAGGVSAGHRVLGDRAVRISSPDEYEATLLAQGVAVDRKSRREALSRRLVELAGEEAVRPVENPELLEEVADLVEYPGAVLGSFPLEFLALPREILVTTLKHHQKAFSTETDEGLANRFLVVCDLDRDAEGHIRKGNEWVVVGRLEDARFFFHEDRKTPFENRRDKLKQITFHAQAGSYADKSARTERTAVEMAQRVNAAFGSAKEPTPARVATGTHATSPGGPKRVALEPLRRAAQLAKCDLTSGLVGEFPELQGIAGGLYIALETGAQTGSDAVSAAVYDHYRPAGAGDEIPRTPEGSVLALADRMDSIVTLGRCVGLPTGSKDPFALRRAAYSAIRIVAETPLPLSLNDLVETAWGPAEAGREPGATSGARTKDGAPAVAVTASDILRFLLERFEFWLKEKGGRYDTINAVLLAAGGQRAPIETLPRLVEKVFALERLREIPEAAALIEIHKRCRNILQQAEQPPGSKPPDVHADRDTGEAQVYQELLERVLEAERKLGSLMQIDAFEEALQELVALRLPITRFFDRVLVMHPDPAIRSERLSVIRKAAVMIEEVADLKEISISREDLQNLLSRLSV